MAISPEAASGKQCKVGGSSVKGTMDSSCGVDFPALEMNAWKPIVPHGEGCSSGPRVHGRPASIREEDFISPGMF
jgi:hypothetical protein